jgi:hypothetical protein
MYRERYEEGLLVFTYGKNWYVCYTMKVRLRPRIGSVDVRFRLQYRPMYLSSNICRFLPCVPGGF